MKRLFVMDCADKDEPPAPMVFINPEIVWDLRGDADQRGGLPLDPRGLRRGHPAGARAPALARPRRRECRRREFADRPAVCVQHELDHLNGRLFIDYLSGVKRTMITVRMKKLKKREGAGLSPAPAAMRLVFMGTPDFAVPALDALAAGGHEIACVYSQPPRPAGRGQQPRPSPVAGARPRRSASPSAPRATLRDPAAQAEFAALGADVAVVVAYGLILPQPVLDAPARGCLNIHASLLPRWRGAAPIQRALMAGDPETGISIMGWRRASTPARSCSARRSRSARATPPATCTTGWRRSARG